MNRARRVSGSHERATVDVAFTSIHELITGVAQGDITFSDVPLTPGADGFASGARPDNRTAATFCGTGHSEVGGTFKHGNALGAFGATNVE